MSGGAGRGQIIEHDIEYEAGWEPWLRAVIVQRIVPKSKPQKKSQFAY